MVTKQEQELEKLKKELDDTKKILNEKYYETAYALIQALYEPKDIEELKKEYLYAEKAYLNAWGKYQDAKKVVDKMNAKENDSEDKEYNEEDLPIEERADYK